MLNQFVIRYQTHPEDADLNEELIRDVFAELADQQPADLEYAVYRLEDGQTFIHLFSSAEVTDALTTLPAFQRFADGASARHAAPAERQSAHLVGRYAAEPSTRSEVLTWMPYASTRARPRSGSSSWPASDR